MNVIMNHANNRTFVDYYRTRRHTGLQEVMLGKQPDEVFARALTRMSRWIDKRRPRQLTDAEKASVEENPELQAAIGALESLADLHRRTREPALESLLLQRQREVTNTRRRLREKLKQGLRQDFSRKQAVIDIDRQLCGSAVNNEGARQVLQREFEMPPAQIHLLEGLLTWPVSDSLEDEWRRRNQGVEAVVQYCDFLEGGPLRGRSKRTVPCDTGSHKDGPPERKIKREDRPSLSVWQEKCNKREEHIRSARKPRICFQCGKEYAQHGGVLRHFRAAHLHDRQCNFCKSPLCNEMHLRNHAAVVHRLHT